MLIRELSEVKSQLESALHDKEEIAQQLESAVRSKEEAVKQQQLEIEELQAQLHLAEIRTRKAECETSERVVDPVDKPASSEDASIHHSMVEETRVTPAPANVSGKSRNAEEFHSLEADDSTSASVTPTKVDTPPVTGPDHEAPTGLGLAYMLPQLQKFSGEDPSGDSFEDWIEQFEMVAKLVGWGSQARLVNLTTRLRGPAYTFYRACLPEQRESYDLLKQELTKRFTPVQIQAIQSEQFHDRKQKEGESVDDYAQDLRRLYRKAYSKAQQGSLEAEKMGRSVLTYQFVAGLCPELKTKIAGTDGNLEQLLMRA